MHEEQRVLKNLSEGTTTAGGFLVPEEFRAEIVRLAPIYGVIRRDARVIPMRYDTLNIPAAGTQDQTATWTNESSTIASTDPTFRQLTLTINKLAAIPSVTNELLDDANVDVLNYLAMIIAEAFASEEDNQGFNGTGSPFVGLLEATGVPTTPLASGTSMESLSYPDLVKASHNIYDNATIGAKYYFHRSMLGHLRSRISTTGSPILLPNQTELAGYPFVSAERLPGTSHASASVGTFPFAIFGNLSRALAMGERGSMTLKLGTEGTVGANNLFEQDMVALRVIERIAMGVLLPSAFTRITT
jgi:HK97 family phage major capsid protein